MKAGQSEANSLRGEKAVEMAGGSGSNGLFPWKLPTLAGPVLIFIMQSPCSCAIHLCDGGQLAPCDPLSDAVCSFVVVFFPPKIRQQRGHGQLLALGCASAKLDRTLLSFFWVVVFFFISSESFGDGAALQGFKRVSHSHMPLISNGERRREVAAEVNLQINCFEHIWLIIVSTIYHAIPVGLF